MIQQKKGQRGEWVGFNWALTNSVGKVVKSYGPNCSSEPYQNGAMHN